MARARWGRRSRSTRTARSRMTRRARRRSELLAQGQSAMDTFSYRASDGHGGTGTATVTMTVAGTLHQAPAVSGIESSALQYDAGTPARAGHLEPDDQRPDDHDAGGRDGVDQLGARRGRGRAGVHEPERDHRQLQRDHRRADADRQRRRSPTTRRRCARSPTATRNGASPTTGTADDQPSRSTTGWPRTT